VVNVGALSGTEKRTFTLSVDVLPPQGGAGATGNRPALQVPAQKR
jgi:hypothetical protein